ncbi:hypothetical protein V8F06_004969 [Rhypophila decipiens]
MDKEVAATIDELLNRLEHIKEIDELRELKRLEAERSLILQDIELCCRVLERTADLILERTKTLSLLKTIAQGTEEKQAAAESKWLGYWGINNGDEKNRKHLRCAASWPSHDMFSEGLALFWYVQLGGLPIWIHTAPEMNGVKA